MIKQKIVYYLNMFLFGGIETSMLEYLRAINPDKFDVTLIVGIHMYELEVLRPQIPAHINIIYVLNGQFLSRNYYRKRLNQLTIGYKTIEVFLVPLRKIYFRFRLTKLLQGYDTVVDYALSLIKYNIVLSGRRIGYFHYSLKEYYLTNMARAKQFSNALANYSKIIILNQHMYDEAQEIFPELAAKFLLMYNQLDFARINRLAQNESEVTVMDDYIVSVGRLEENQKDFATLIKAYKIFREKYNHNEKLVIIGSGKDQDQLQSLINDLGLNFNVLLVGHKTNPFPWIYHSKLFAFSSKFEGLAMVLVEAMILQKAVVATACPNGPSEVLMNGDCGRLVTVGDKDGLAQAIHELLTNNQKYQDYVNYATKHLDRFNIQYNIRRFTQLLTD